MNQSVIDFRPTGTSSSDVILDAFMEAMESKGISLYEAQEEAIMELMEDQHVILNTPTGSGKSMVALALHFKALCEGKKGILYLADQSFSFREIFQSL